MYRLATYRHVDEPVKLLGLEVEDWAAFLLIFGLGIFIFPLVGILGEGTSRVGAVLVAIGTTIALRRIKRGRPRGYLKYLVHKWGLSRLLPRKLRIKGALPAPLPWESRRSIVLIAPPRRNYYERP